ncbi:MAG: isoprenylcysteine carboxylmethyltransferase family protein [Candidatus Hydrogenedentales bacterium]
MYSAPAFETWFTSDPFALGFRALFAVAFLLMIGRAAAYRRKAYAGESFDVAQEGTLVLTLRRVVVIAALSYLMLYVAGWRWLSWSLVSLPVTLRWIGCALSIVVAPLLGEWVYRHLGENVTPTVVIRRKHTLVTTGPYRWVRHPLYLVGTMFHLSLILVSGSWLLLVMLIVGVGTIAARTRKEEANLAAHFGDAYEDYRRRTGRLVPRIRRKE